MKPGPKPGPESLPAMPSHDAPTTVSAISTLTAPTSPASTKEHSTDTDTDASLPAPANGAEKKTEDSSMPAPAPSQQLPGRQRVPDMESAVPADPAPPTDNHPPSSELKPQQFAILSIGIGLGLFLAMLDSSIVATSLLAISRDLGSVELINWIALSYTLAYLSCTVVFARIADIVGRRNAFLAGFILFISFSIGCGFAQNLHQLIAMRALQGIGGSGLYSVSMIMWPELCPLRMRAQIAGLAGIVVGVAGVLGPILGGLLTKYTSWKWIFWINGPIGVFSMTIFILTWPDKKDLPHIKRNPWSSLDIVGSTLLVAAAALVTFAFQNAGVNPNQWNQATFLAPLITGVFAWIALFAWQWAIETHWTHIMPAFPLGLLRDRCFAFAVLTTLLTGYPFFATIFSVPLRMQIVNGKSGLMAGVMLLPLLGGVSVGSAITGAINKRRNRLCETMVVACILMVIGCSLEATQSDPVPHALGFLPFIGLGLGMVAATSTTLASTSVPLANRTAAQGIVAQMRVLGGSIGIAASSAILAQQQIEKLGAVISSENMPTAGDSHAAVLVREAFSEAFKENMEACAIISGVAVVCAFGIYDRNRKPLVVMIREHESNAR